MSLDTLYVIFVIAPAVSGLFVLVINRAYWLRRLRGARQTREPVPPVPPAAEDGGVPLSPATVEDPPADSGAEARPDHGADELFADELHELRDAEVSAELISDVEVELRWAATWHEFEQHLRDQVEDIFASVLVELERPRSFAELRELLELPAAEDRELVSA